MDDDQEMTKKPSDEEAMLRERELRYRRLFETDRDGIVLLTADTGAILDINPAFVAMSGHEPEELLGKKLVEITPFSETDAGAVIITELQERDHIYYPELPFHAKDGSWISAEIIGSALTIGNDRVLQCTVRDITRRKAVEHNLWRAESRFRAVFDYAAMGIAVMDGSGRIVECNNALSKMLGYSNQEMIGRVFSDFIHAEDRAADAGLYRELTEQKRDSYQMAIQCVKKDGSIAWGLLASSLMHKKADDPVYAIRMLEDITNRKRAEDAFIKSRNFYLSLIDELPNPIQCTDVDGKSDYFNRAWLAFTARTTGQEVGDGWSQGVHPDDINQLRKIQADTFRSRIPYVTEYRLLNYAGEYRWVIEFGRPFDDIDGSFGGYISSCYDVQERKNFEKKLQSISTTDDLTGLLNRRGFFSLAQQQLKVASRTRKGLLLFYADLDGLKKINDSLGHPEGDQALIETASVLKEIFRESDIIGRLGGDEFAVLMYEHVKDEQAILMRIRESIKTRNDQPGRRYTLSISAGMKFYDPNQPCSLDELISRADTLMYQDKESKYREQEP